MKTLKEVIDDAAKGGYAVGHFNISDLAALKAIFEAAREVSAERGSVSPVVIGVSEGEREFVGVRQAAALVRSLREEHGYPIFLNADHTHSLEKVEEAAKAGFDAVLFDPTPNFVKSGTSGGGLLEENMRQTAEAARIAKKANKKILMEGEIGYIGSSSAIFERIPEGAAIKPEDLTKPEEAREFVKRTGVDLLAPAVGNVHGMYAGAKNPRLDIERIAAIRKAAGVPLVLHGGSGVEDDDFRAAIKAGVSVVHINTEIRVAWRKGVEEGLAKNPKEIAPYKILPPAIETVKKTIKERMRLFSGS